MKTSRNSSSVKVPTPQLNRHDLSHQHLTSMDYFRLQPIECFECIAGDKISMNIRSMVDSAPLATKVYGSARLDLHAFFVPFRLLWDEWNNYYYQNINPLPSFPTLNVNNSTFYNKLFPDNLSVEPKDTPTAKALRSVFASLGYPIFQDKQQLKGGFVYNALPWRAYQRVWWDWFRDSVNIVETDKPNYLNTASGPMQEASYNNIAPRYRTYQKDPITTLLSSRSAGIGSSATKVNISTELGSSSDTYTGQARDVMLSQKIEFVADQSALKPLSNAPKLLQSLQIPILRGAIAAQRFLERLGISGTRSLDRILSTFGIKPAPERLDMCEFIGWKSIPIGFDGLVNTGSGQKLSSTDSPFGNDTNGTFGSSISRGMASGQSETWQYHAQEHGYIMVMASIVPEYLNVNCVPQYLSRGAFPNSEGPKDFFQPDFDGSGYQDVLLGSVALPLKGYPATSGWTGLIDVGSVVGYQPYGEGYRYELDRLSGDFLEQKSSTYLRNMALIRNIPAVLNPSQVQAGITLTTPTDADVALFDNNFQVTNQLLDHFIVNNNIIIDALRPVSSSGLPTELSDLANADLKEVSKLGVRL